MSFHTVAITALIEEEKKSYICVDGKVSEAMPDGDEWERANDGKRRGAGLQLMKVFTIKRTFLTCASFINVNELFHIFDKG